ncbi:MAG: winged helix-turn-helix domain-containing protein [Halobacteriota archaeon]|nr:winged helix-turn-helix domain-containing protein [Halobacteriota archaeon]
MYAELYGTLEFDEVYEKASDWLRLLARSEIRVKVLLILNEGTKKLGQLREMLDLSSSTILHAMRGMEVEGLIEHTEIGYTLSNVGKIQAILVNDMIKTIAVLSKDKDFWLTHDLSGIPEYLLKRIGELNGCEVVVATPEDILKIFSSYFQMITSAKEMRSLTSIFHPDFPDAVKALVKRRANVELILTRNVMEKMIETDRDILESLIPEANFGLWLIDEEVKETFTITDSALSLGFYRHDGAYDVATDLIARGDVALNWGRDLFEYYRKRAKMIGLDDIGTELTS